MDIASSKTHVKENIKVKTAGIPQTASRSRPAQRDTLNLAKYILLEAANSKTNVPTAIRKIQ